MGTTLTILNKLPVLRKRKIPSLAFVIGFLFGGIGLGLYFRSFIDFLAPLALILALSLAGGVWRRRVKRLSHRRLHSRPLWRLPSGKLE